MRAEARMSERRRPGSFARESPQGCAARYDLTHESFLAGGLVSTPTTTDAADLDPFERFNRMNGMGRVENPYPVFIELRGEAPIQKADLRKMFGLEVPEPPPGSPPVYSASSYEAVLQVLRD